MLEVKTEAGEATKGLVDLVKPAPKPEKKEAKKEEDDEPTPKPVIILKQTAAAAPKKSPAGNEGSVSWTANGMNFTASNYVQKSDKEITFEVEAKK